MVSVVAAMHSPFKLGEDILLEACDIAEREVKIFVYDNPAHTAHCDDGLFGGRSGTS